MAIDAFVSYSRVDRAKVEVLATALQRAPMVVVWDGEFAGGDEFAQTIADSIRRAKVFVLAVSEASMRSDWVSRELEAALTAGTPILPMMLDNTPLPPTVGHLSALDFRNWDGDGDADIVAKLINDVQLLIATREKPLVQMAELRPSRRDQPETPYWAEGWIFLGWTILVTGFGMSLKSSGIPILGEIVIVLGLLPVIFFPLLVGIGIFIAFGVLPPLGAILFIFIFFIEKQKGERLVSALFACFCATLTIFITPAVWSSAGGLMESIPIFSRNDPATSAEVRPAPLTSAAVVPPNAPSTELARPAVDQSARIAERASEMMASNSACDFARLIASGRNAAGELPQSNPGWNSLRHRLYGEPRQAWLERADLCKTLDHERRDLAIAVAYCLREEPIVEQSDWVGFGVAPAGGEGAQRMSERIRQDRGNTGLPNRSVALRRLDGRPLIDAFFDAGCLHDDVEDMAPSLVGRLPLVVDLPAGDEFADVRRLLEVGELSRARDAAETIGTGNREALHIVGVIDAFSPDPQVRRKGYDAVRRAAHLGSVAAKANEGLMLMIGIGVYADPVAGSERITQALAEGLTLSDATAIWSSALSGYTIGTFSEAMQGLQLLADQGDTASLALIGMLNAKGIGRPPCHPDCRRVAEERANALALSGHDAWALVVRAQWRTPSPSEISTAGWDGVYATSITAAEKLRSTAASAMASAELGHTVHSPSQSSTSDNNSSQFDWGTPRPPNPKISPICGRRC